VLETSSKQAFKVESRKLSVAASARCPEALGVGGDAAGGFGETRRAEPEGLSCYSGAIYWSQPTEGAVAAGKGRETWVGSVAWPGSHAGARAARPP